MALDQLAGYTPAQSQTTNDPANITTNNHGVALQNIDPATMTVSGQLQTLLSGNNPLLQMAQQQGAQAAAARGSVNGTLFAAASQGAAQQAMQPVAQANAAEYAHNADANQGAINAEGLQSLQNQGQIGAAAASAHGQVEAARLRNQEAQHEFDTSLATSQANREQDRTWQVADQQTSQQAYQRDAVLNASLGAVFSDPAYWSNPEASLNMVHTFSNGFDQIWNDTNGGGTQAFATPQTNPQTNMPQTIMANP